MSEPSETIEFLRHCETLTATGVAQAIGETLKRSFFAEWMASDPSDTKLREQLYNRALAVDMLLTNIENFASESERLRKGQ